MPRLCRLSIVLLVMACAAPASSPAVAVAQDSTGGASADSASGGIADVGALAYGAPVRQRPVARIFRVTPRRTREGARRRVRLRIRVIERGIRRVSARVVAIDPETRRVGASFELGRIRANRTITRRWPRRAMPEPGAYVVRLHVKDPDGATLARAASTTGKSRLIVRPRPRPENSQPEPPAQPIPPAPPAPVPAVPVLPGSGVFPVQGAHTFGADDGRFGAGRPGHRHEGQDIPAADGTPVVSPVAGTVRFVDNQPSAAGWYVVLDADDGRSMFFAHLQRGSITVVPGQRVAAGQGLGLVGHTGSASGPHLHFEIWEGGWRDRGGHPIDPLPQLQAWDS